MSFKIDSNDFGDFLSFDQSGSNGRTGWGNDNQKLFRYYTPKGEISFKEEAVQDNLSILYGNYQLDDDVTIYGKGDSSLLEMHFNLSDHDILYHGKTRTTDTARPMAGNLTFLAADDNKATIGFKKDTAYNTFDIHLPLRLLIPYAGESKSIDDFLNNVAKGVSTKLAADEVSVSAKIYSVIQDIKNCKYERLSRRIYLESKILELLAESIHSIENDQAPFSLLPSDVERIKYAGQLIRENIANPLTIIELARKAGINQTKLKTGFKVVFGNTVFGYLQEIRMHEAKRYLLDSDLTLQQITQLSGYTSLSNFSIAFKRIFGYPPTKLR